MGGSDRRRPGRSWAGGDRREAQRRVGTDRRRDSKRREGAERRRAERRTAERRSEADWAPVPLEIGVIRDPPPDAALVAAAAGARRFAQARYSGFEVGAALETEDGRVVTGCNIENATYGLTLCAERVALVKALSDGHVVFTRLAVVADADAPVPPCGPCRQLLWEYCGDIEVVLASLDRVTGRHRLSTLLPLPFDRRLLE